MRFTRGQRIIQETRMVSEEKGEVHTRNQVQQPIGRTRSFHCQCSRRECRVQREHPVQGDNHRSSFLILLGNPVQQSPGSQSTPHRVGSETSPRPHTEMDGFPEARSQRPVGPSVLEGGDACVSSRLIPPPPSKNQGAAGRIRHLGRWPPHP